MASFINDSPVDAFGISDSSGGISAAYDAAGNLTNAAGSAGFVFDYIYDAASMLAGETIINSGVTNTLSRLYDAFRRPASTALTAGGTFAQGVAYAYDGAGQLASVAATNAHGRAFRLEYTNSPGLALGHRVTTPGGNVITRAVTRDPLRPHLVTGVTNFFNGSVISAWTYRYDAIGRVISRNADTFGYNTRSELTSATLHTNAYGYVYDPIGNSLVSTVNGAETSYTANALNQYTAISAPSAPPREPQYDADGNLIALGDRTFVYDAENRMTGVSSNGIPAASYTYDHRHRRIRKTTSAAVHDFIYDKWNLLRGTVTSNGVSSTVDYFWGNDISGSLQGAGGVGGLIAASIGGQFYFALYDNNGNITEYVNESGSVMANYAYDAFGNIISQSAPMADAFRFRFSTKHHDSETGHYYYGRRFYMPELGRWLNRDPIEEDGGLNLYGFIDNSPMDTFDVLGLAKGKIEHPPWWQGGAVQKVIFPNPGKLGEIRVYLSENNCDCICSDNFYYLRCTLSLNYTIRIDPVSSPKWKTTMPSSFPTWTVPEDYMSWPVKKKRKFVEQHERKHLAAYTAWHKRRLHQLTRRESLKFPTSGGCRSIAEYLETQSRKLFNRVHWKEVRHADW